jgi:Rad3-related DNA helicase
VALGHEICPYYLSQEMVRWADVVVSDYNYYFDSAALLHTMTRANEWRVAVLVDEAHNLVERARAMYSVNLGSDAIRAVFKTAPVTLRGPIGKLKRAVGALAKGQDDAYRAYEEVPQRLMATLKDVSAAVSEYLVTGPEAVDQELLRLYFDALRFVSLDESFSTHSLFDVTRSNHANKTRRASDAVLCIRNVTPAPFLKPRFTSAQTVVLFSATLSPHHFYSDALGLPEDTAWIDVESPFTPDQLDVRIVTDVSTRFNHRERSLAQISALMAAHYGSAPGNYLAFFSSFDYAEQAFESSSDTILLFQCGCQRRRMDGEERTAFLARFHARRFWHRIRCARGRVRRRHRPAGFSPDRRLRRDARAAAGESGERGDEAQARPHHRRWLRLHVPLPRHSKGSSGCWRVIRTPTDRGHLFLIDDRFGRPESSVYFQLGGE